MLYREPKLLKVRPALQPPAVRAVVSVLYREPKLLKAGHQSNRLDADADVSVLYREPKLLKVAAKRRPTAARERFSALP